MDRLWTGLASGGGLLPDARRALDAVIAKVDRLAGETAWECAAAREYRAELAALLGQVGSVGRAADQLEDELRTLWRQVAAGVG